MKFDWNYCAKIEFTTRQANSKVKNIGWRGGGLGLPSHLICFFLRVCVCACVCERVRVGLCVRCVCVWVCGGVDVQCVAESVWCALPHRMQAPYCQKQTWNARVFLVLEVVEVIENPDFFESSGLHFGSHFVLLELILAAIWRPGRPPGTILGTLALLISKIVLFSLPSGIHFGFFLDTKTKKND